MPRKGQISIFIIIAIIIVGTVGLFFSLRNNEQITFFSPKTDQIRNFVDECIEDISEETIRLIGQGGGYIYPPLKSNSLGNPYYYFEGKENIPSLTEIEKEISNYIEKKLFLCTKGFEQFLDYEIEQKTILVQTEINDQNILFHVIYPLSITRENNIILLREFEIEIQSNLKQSYILAENITLDIINDGNICLSCILDFAENKNFELNILDYNLDTEIFIIKDRNIKINEKYSEFIFAVKY